MKKSKDLCSGCYNDSYNHGLGGSKECWSFESAKVVKRKKVHIDQVPPWEQEAIEVLDCRTERRFVFVDADKDR